MNRIKICALALGCVFTFLADAAIPEVTNVSVSQPNGSGRTEITYSLVNGPAVVTMDIETNGPSGWVSIGLENVYGTMKAVSGDVNKIVSGTTGRIRWAAHKTWADRTIADGGLRAVLTAWPTDDTPDYMVVDLNAGSDSADRIRYYVSANALPGGGLLGNVAYRTTHLVLKKVVAKGVPWTMGQVNEFVSGGDAAKEKAHEVTLDHNYYMAVFPLTQRQGILITGDANLRCSFPIDGDMRILDRINFRTGDDSGNYARGVGYPADPADNSILGKLRTRTANAVDFDLPSEAQWEYAAKAGCGEGYWGRRDMPIDLASTNGFNYAVDPNLPGRYVYTQATPWVRITSGGDTLADWLANRDHLDPSNGIPIAGSYAPNNWGFYDLFGSVREWCQDLFQDDITGLNGAINVNGAVDYRVLRGGCWFSTASECRPSCRYSGQETYPGACTEAGVRICCRAGLK